MLNKEKTDDLKTPKPTISLSETLERFNKFKPKKVNLEDLQLEVNQIKNEMKQLKNENNKLESKNANLEDWVSILELNKKFELINTQNDSSSEDEKPESSTHILIKSDDEIRYCNIINKITLVKWHTKVKIIIEKYEIEVIVLVDTGTDLNCIQEGLIPTKYFEKSTERLKFANWSQMIIK